ncbi:MAG: TIR domain-containing protein, partial [bacterium]|nr:TIR domain-containing protein [bacterium]
MTADQGSKPPVQDFFISYNRADRQWAEWLAWILDEDGYSVVIDAWDFRPGHNFVIEMDRAASAARHTAVVLSPHYLGAGYTHPEWAAAFASDPQGRDRRLIPFRVAECPTEGLLAQIVYVDLLGLDEDQAVAAVRDALKVRGKPDQRPAFPGRPGQDSGIRRRVPFPGLRVDITPDISRLPVTGEHFVGRDDHLARLDAAWDDAGVHVVSLVAWGGVGKSALVNHWLAGLAQDDYRGAARVMGWSFYSQGTDEDRVASADPFIDHALRQLGDA